MNASGYLLMISAPVIGFAIWAVYDTFKFDRAKKKLEAEKEKARQDFISKFTPTHAGGPLETPLETWITTDLLKEREAAVANWVKHVSLFDASDLLLLRMVCRAQANEDPAVVVEADKHLRKAFEEMRLSEELLRRA